MLNGIVMAALMLPNAVVDDFHWSSESVADEGGFLTSWPVAATLEGHRVDGPAEAGGGLVFDGETTALILPLQGDERSRLPVEAMTVSAWVSVDVPKRWGRDRRLRVRQQ